MDLLAFMAATAAAAAEPAKIDPVPRFPTQEAKCGNEQAIDKQYISRISHNSHELSAETGSTHAGNLQAGASVRASAGARESPAGGGGNVGTLGNARRINDFPFPQHYSKVGNVGKDGATPPLLPADDGLTIWRAGLALLAPAAPPCPGYRADEWSRTLARMLTFLDEFGEQAEALSWTAPRLFGVHPQIGIVRVDHCGALVLPLGGPVRAITATEISFGHLTHREKPGQPEGVLIWEFGR